jgi:hypothetical protein
MTLRTLPEIENTLPKADFLNGASHVWLEEQGPVVLSVLEIQNRYHSVALPVTAPS